MERKISLKLLTLMVLNLNGLTYKEISRKTNFHMNTISRAISYLYNKDLIEIMPKKGNGGRGKKWINVVKLKADLTESKNVVDFFDLLNKKLRLID